MSGTVTDERKRELIDQIQREQENLQQCESEIRLTNPLYGALKYPPPIDLRATQQLLGDTTLLVNFSLGSERSFVWIVSHSSTHLIELPASSSIEKHVYAFLKEIRKRPTAATCTYSLRRIHQLGRSLFQMLLGETAGYLAAVNQLIIVPDGILHYLPFEALTLPTRLNLKVRSTPMFLGELVPVGYVQSATVLAHLRNVHPIVTPVYDLLAFGDPTFSSLRKSQGDSAFLDLSSQDVTTRSIEELGRAIIPLPSTRSEVQQIGALFPPERVKLCLGADATERRLKSEPLASYRFIHFATHGVIDENAPGLSGLLLSTNGDTTNDGFLQANEIFNLDLNADVVVLSACETGLGKLLRGEGMIGLTRAFQYAGARSVVVSLWKVADASTAAFMTRVYTSLATGKSPASALHDAKAVMLCSPVALWHHPFHWAGFVVEGGL